MSSNEFREQYLQLLVKDWTDDGFGARVDADAKGALAEVGIVIPDGVDVEVIRHGQDEVNPYEGKSNEAALDAQEAIFEAGLKSGKVQIHLPDAPSTEEGILSESDLSEVAAGEVPCCCCCC